MRSARWQGSPRSAHMMELSATATCKHLSPEEKQRPLQEMSGPLETVSQSCASMLVPMAKCLPGQLRRMCRVRSWLPPGGWTQHHLWRQPVLQSNPAPDCMHDFSAQKTSTYLGRPYSCLWRMDKHHRGGRPASTTNPAQACRTYSLGAHLGPHSCVCRAPPWHGLPHTWGLLPLHLPLQTGLVALKLGCMCPQLWPVQQAQQGDPTLQAARSTWQVVPRDLLPSLHSKQASSRCIICGRATVLTCHCRQLTIP